jgi:hypothetical protein
MNDQQLVYVMKMGADTLQRLINRNQKLDSEINHLKMKYQKDVEQIRKVAETLMKQIHPETIVPENKPEAQKVIQPVKKEKTPAQLGLSKKMAEIQRINLTPELPKVEGWNRIIHIKGLNRRTYAVLRELRVHYVRDLRRVTLRSLNDMKHCGPKTIAQIKHVMDHCGYTLG